MDSDSDYPLDEEEDERRLDDKRAHGRKQPEPRRPRSQIVKKDSLAHEAADSESGVDVRSLPYREGTPLKRAAEDNEADIAPGRALKLQKSTFNNDYLDLLNRDIEDASQHICLEDNYDLGPSQIGLTYWTSMEKRVFFEALARLGKDETSGIASRLGTKSVVEVKQYISGLQKERDIWQKKDHRHTVEPSELPAAIELSQSCCNALDEAAEAVSARLERREEQREEAKWGPYWEITPRIAWDLDTDADALANPQFRSLRFFQLSQWLKLSTRAFMNSSTPGNNWNLIGEGPPSVWASTFDDFYSLVVSITRRLVQTTLFISMSRIRAKREFVPATRGFVRRKDAEAAIASLGLALNAKSFWLRSARRLRLDVYEDPSGGEEDSEAEPMDYDEVEKALSGEPSAPQQKATRHDTEVSSDLESEGIYSSSSDENEEAGDITEEEDEVLRYSAADFPETYRAKEALRKRIASEQGKEAYADQYDEHVSAQAEMEMWQLLQKQPPRSLAQVRDPGPLHRSNRKVEDLYEVGRDWRQRTPYYSEWETLGQMDKGSQ